AITEQSVSQGPTNYILLVAILSVALGFTNLLPVPALDGGRIVVVLIEALRRRPFDRKSELNFQRWGLVALLGLAAIISFLDIHYDHTLALTAIQAGLHWLRLNPGNIPDRDKVIKVVTAAKERQIPFRIGVNAGSLPEEVHKSLREQHQINRDDREQTADRMVEVALGHCKILEDLDYGPGFIKVSLKSTDVWTNIMANRKFAAARAYPIHLGVTESGPVEAGSIRSAVGMGILLSEGIGDT